MSRRLPVQIEMDIVATVRELGLWSGRTWDFALSKLGREIAKERGVRSLVELEEEQGLELLAWLESKIKRVRS